MIEHPGHKAQHWYVDVRSAASTEHMSLDLSRHLPRRLAVGPAIIVSERPTVLLSVVRKRWAKIVREVTLQHASTLNAQKRAGLQHELDHMQQCRFTVKSFTQSPSADCFFIGRGQLFDQLPPCYPTLYLTTWLSAKELYAVTRGLPLRGLIVSYGEWPTGYEAVLHETFQDRFKQYSEGAYPTSPASYL